ncbi:MFS transporter [Streptomyces sp. TP-A0874]|uniref:MFS transporter n=1 Tax=Streptomyces sp. TP-A0874 TaxID=549819 RepID=UPI0009A0643D|nr:MFS transporter [Streptomyces sp. TP-A0874]
MDESAERHGGTVADPITVTDAGPAPVRPTWRGGFGLLCSAAVLSRFGDALRSAALPLLAVSLTDSPLLVSLVTACGFLPWLVFGLLGGAVADRVDQRRAMWAVDILRGLLMAGFSVAVLLGHATIALLLGLAFTLTTLQTLFDNAATALLPCVVPDSALPTANARLMTGQQIAGSFVAAPLVPALLVLGIAAPFGVNAVTYLLAALLVAGVRVERVLREPRAAGATLRRDIAEGLRTLWRDRMLRVLCASEVFCNIGVGALIATLVLHVTGWLDAGETGYAAVITAYGVGSVVGGLVAGRLARLLGAPLTLMLGGALQVVCLVVLGLARSLPVAMAAMAAFGFVGMVWNVIHVTLMQQRSPLGMLGRVSSAFRTVSVGVTPLGALLGGVVATAWGLNAPALLAAALFLLGVVSLVPAVRRPEVGGTPSTAA